MSKDLLNQEIREKIRRFRIRSTDIASRLGVTKQYVWGIINGKYKVSISRLEEINSIVDEIIEMKKNANTWFEKLKVARLVKGLTAEEVSEITGYDKQSIYNWESGKSLPRIGIVRLLAKVYELSDDELNFILSSIINEGENRLVEVCDEQ